MTNIHHQQTKSQYQGAATHLLVARINTVVEGAGETNLPRLYHRFHRNVGRLSDRNRQCPAPRCFHVDISVALRE